MLIENIFLIKRIGGYSRSWLIVNYTFHAGSVEGIAIGELTFHHTDGCVQPFVSFSYALIRSIVGVLNPPWSTLEGQGIRGCSRDGGRIRHIGQESVYEITLLS